MSGYFDKFPERRKLKTPLALPFFLTLVFFEALVPPLGTEITDYNILIAKFCNKILGTEMTPSLF